MDGLVTIIVPVFNKREYISKCIVSLTGQTFADLQILLVDDGSDDGSGHICDGFARQDSRIRVIRKANAGVSAARNTGLEYATGEWIAFVDADDFVSPYYIEDMLAAARDGSDIVICRYASLGQSHSDIDPFVRGGGSKRITGRQACIYRFGKQLPLYNRCWGKLYRAFLWEGQRFPEGMAVGEDIFVSHALLYKAGSVTITDAALYAYVLNDDSVMQRAFGPEHLGALDAWQEAVRFFSQAGDKELENIARRVYCSRLFDALAICGKLLPDERELNTSLKARAADAHMRAKPIRGYIDVPPYMAFAYKFKFFLGRRSLPLYAALFVGDRTGL